MKDHQPLPETEPALEQERLELELDLRRTTWRRMQMLPLLLAFLGATGWTGYYFYFGLYGFLRSAEFNAKAAADTVFWGMITFLLLYVVVIVYRERSSTVDQADQAERRLARVSRRLQQLVLERAGAPSPPHGKPAAAHASSSSHVSASPAHGGGAHPAPGTGLTAGQPQAPAPPVDRGPIVLDLDAADTKECPMCAERVRERAKVCRYCHYEFETMSS